MKLNRTDNLLSREARIAENQNWQTIEDNFNNVVQTVSDKAYGEVVDAAKLNWKEPVASFTNLPTTANTGDTMMTRDTGKVYRYNGTEFKEIQEIDAGPVNEVDSRLTSQLADIAVYARDFGVVSDGTTDNSTNLLNALEYANGRKVIIPTGVCKVSQKITYSGKVNIDTSSGAIIDFSNGGSFSFSNVPTTVPNLSSDIIAGSNRISFSASHGLAKGDVIIVSNPTDFSWASYRSYYKDGCMFRVDEVVSNTTVKIFGVSPDNYVYTDMAVYKLNGEGIELNGIDVIPNPTINVQVWIDGHQNVKILSPNIREGASQTGIEVWRSFDVNVSNFKGEVFSGDGYPITISNSQKVVLSKVSSYSSRHSVALGGRDGFGVVPTRDILISHSILMNRSDSGIGSADIHGCCENITYSNCILNTGANMAGANVKYVNCTITGRNPDAYPDGNCIFGAEIVSGTFEVDNCKLITYGDGANFAGGVHLDVSKREGDVTVIINRCVIENKNNSTSLRAITLDVGDSGNINSNKIDVEINGLKVISDSPIFTFLMFQGLNDISNLSTCIVDNVTGGSSNLVATSNVVNYNMPMRLQRQSGYQKITAEVGSSSTVGTSQFFKYRYPKQPTAQISSGSDTALMFNGSAVVLSGVYRVRKDEIIPFITTGDSSNNWTSTKETNVMWTVAVEEF